MRKAGETLFSLLIIILSIPFLIVVYICYSFGIGPEITLFLAVLTYIFIIYGVIYWLKREKPLEMTYVDRVDQYKVVKIDEMDQYRELNDYFVYQITYIHIESGKKTTKIIVHEHPLWEQIFNKKIVSGSTF